MRPGRLTDRPASGKVTVGPRLEGGEVSRADVAAVLVGCLDEQGTIGAAFDLLEGESPIAEALAGLRS